MTPSDCGMEIATVEKARLTVVRRGTRQGISAATRQTGAGGRPIAATVGGMVEAAVTVG